MDTELILADEAARQEALSRARRKASAENVVTNLRQVVEKNAQRCAPFKEQLRLCDELELLIVKIAPGVQGPGSFMIRDKTIELVCALRNDQMRRLEKLEGQLKGERAKLAAAEKTVAELEG